ncbi:multifunctional CCA addition/repair protein [Aestuariibacter salexigens]|uniref:multifunctional CCA addition/repair protein n=1 Tax=Aestuariibacter salexigens TaxID=226010 RepID=UPI00041825CF|nr:multifunctional CCA addition/repair protein [Aestuariibacter salexigens]
MKIYLVGGAVRDELLGRPVHERDYVVVGATPEQMLEKGFTQVGKDFPVFLHPKTKEEYALARTERKTGSGYTGFECNSAPTVTLEQDLMRRDLTVNAMAKDENGQLIDPYNGQQDLQNRVLRHVSDAFVEDPLRVLRVARFASRYYSYGFSIANETLELMRTISQSGELEHLSAERVWKETERSLQQDTPQVYFETLRACGALRFWFNEVDVLWGISNPAKWHPEVDTGIHTMMVLEQAAKLSDDVSVRFAALVHDVGKSLTDADQWPSHHGHEKLGLTSINTLCDRLKVPNACRELALLVGEFHSHVHGAFQLTAKTVLKVLNKCDAWRKPERFEALLLACTADAKGRKQFENSNYPQADYFRAAWQAAANVSVKDIVAQGYQGQQIRDELERQRIAAIENIRDTQSS